MIRVISGDGHTILFAKRCSEGRLLVGVLYNRLLILLNETPADSTFYHIALCMLRDFEPLVRMSIAEVADLCHVSKSTISKFIRALGYEDFASFRYAAEIESLHYRPEHTFVHNVLGYLDGHSCQEYLASITADMAATLQALDMSGLDRLVQDIYTHERVGAFGLMFSATAAIDLQIKLGRIGRYIATNMDDAKMADYLRRAGPDTLVVLFSDQGTFMDRREMVDPLTHENLFSQTKAHLVMITSNPAMAKDPRIDYIVTYARLGELHTHRFVYPLLTDLLASKYYALTKKKPS